MFRIDDHTITYAYYPKMETKWQKKFARQTQKVATDYGLSVEYEGVEEHTLTAIYSAPGLDPVFTEEVAEEIHGKYFGDFH